MQEDYTAYPEAIELCKNSPGKYVDVSNVKVMQLKNGSYAFKGVIILNEDIPQSSTVRNIFKQLNIFTYR